MVSSYQAWALLTAIAALLSGSHARGPIALCSDVGCPVSQNALSKCTIGNVTTGQIGVVNFTSGITQDPLTWTLAVQNTSAQYTLVREYLLGTPPSLDLRNGDFNGKQACALFFEGISSKLRFWNGTNSSLQGSSGTCKDALNGTCIPDLLSQAKNELGNILQNEERFDPTSVCAMLGDALRTKAPSSCSIDKADWGMLLSRPITGSNASQALQGGDCRPSTGKNYNISLVAANDYTFDNKSYLEADKLFPVAYGITPILTVTYGKTDLDTAMDLSCVKAPADNPNLGPNGKKLTGGAPGRSEGSSLGLLAGSIVLGAALIGAL